MAVDKKRKEVLASTGYLLTFVGKGHHLADVRGYAYSHRLAGEIKLGRKLRKGEEVHHLDEDRTNNHPDNLKVCRNKAWHRYLHRTLKNKNRLKRPNEKNKIISCKCGCGGTFLKYDGTNRPREYVSGHNDHPAITREAILNCFKKSETITLQQLIINTKLRKGTVKSVLVTLVQNKNLLRKKRGLYELPPDSPVPLISR